MANTHNGSVSLIGATLAGGLAFLLIPSGLLWIASLMGLILLLTLLAYDGSEKRSVLQSITFAAVCGLCLTLVSLAVYQFLLNGVAPEFPQLTRTWLPITYLCATVLMLFVDLARMPARTGTVPVSGSLYSPAAPSPVPVNSAFSIQPVVQPPPGPAATVDPQPAAVPQPVPVEPHLVRNSQPVQPPPQAVPIKPGKETNIYVNLVGEGLNMLRAVRAEHLGKDYYRIVESMPETEKWEYGTGQVVLCRKKNLSSGKALVAVEEAPRAQ